MSAVPAKKSHKSDRLFYALAEQLKLPLLQIARQAELSKLSGDNSGLESIELTADTTLKLIDNYLLSIKMAKTINLEPVSISAVLNRVAGQLDAIAGRYQCELQLHLSGKYEPVMADAAGLEAALTSLGYVFIESQTHNNSKHRPVVKLAAHRGKTGIVAGMFSESEGLGGDMFRRAHQLYGHAQQPLPDFSSGSGAGVFVAESLLGSMSARLRVARHQKLSGLAATFSPSKQLALI